MEKIGFLGLGAMGIPMARNIRQGGYPLAVYNRTAERAQPLLAEGVELCATPRELAGRSEVVVIMVTGPDDLLAVVGGSDGVAAGLTKGKVVINMSTVSPCAVEAAAGLVRASGAEFVDAPVSGSVKPAEQAALVILAGADSTVLKRVTPLLRTMGREVVHCGGVGAGTGMKLVLNLMLGNMMQTLAEGMNMGRGFGLDPNAVLYALAGGAMAAPMYQVKGKAIVEGNFVRQFPLHLMFKDLNLVLEAAGRLHIPLPQTAATRECFNGAMARGLRDEDMAAVVKVLEGLTGKTLCR